MINQVTLRRNKRVVVLTRVSNEITRVLSYYDYGATPVADYEILRPIEQKQANLVAMAYEIITSI